MDPTSLVPSTLPSALRSVSSSCLTYSDSVRIVLGTLIAACFWFGFVSILFHVFRSVPTALGALRDAAARGRRQRAIALSLTLDQCCNNCTPPASEHAEPIAEPRRDGGERRVDSTDDNDELRASTAHPARSIRARRHPGIRE